MFDTTLWFYEPDIQAVNDRIQQAIELGLIEQAPNLSISKLNTQTRDQALNLVVSRNSSLFEIIEAKELPTSYFKHESLILGLGDNPYLKHFDQEYFLVTQDNLIEYNG